MKLISLKNLEVIGILPISMIGIWIPIFIFVFSTKLLTDRVGKGLETMTILIIFLLLAATLSSLWISVLSSDAFILKRKIVFVVVLIGLVLGLIIAGYIVYVSFPVTLSENKYGTFLLLAMPIIVAIHQIVRIYVLVLNSANQRIQRIIKTVAIFAKAKIHAAFANR